MIQWVTSLNWSQWVPSLSWSELGTTQPQLVYEYLLNLLLIVVVSCICLSSKLQISFLECIFLNLHEQIRYKLAYILSSQFMQCSIIMFPFGIIIIHETLQEFNPRQIIYICSAKQCKQSITKIAFHQKSSRFVTFKKRRSS